MAKPLLIAQISDLHIKPPGELAYGRVDTAAAFVLCVASLNEFRPAPDFVVISGDHDSREMMRPAFPKADYAFPSGALNQKIEVGELELLLLDSCVAGKPHGLLERPTLQWLDTTLSASVDRPALLFLHHPPFATGICHMDRQNLHHASDLAAIVQRHPRARLIACGHVHRAT